MTNEAKDYKLIVIFWKLKWGMLMKKRVGLIMGFCCALMVGTLNVQAATVEEKLISQSKQSIGSLWGFEDKAETKLLSEGTGCYLGNGLVLTQVENIYDVQKMYFYIDETNEAYLVAGVVKYDAATGLTLLKLITIPEHFKALDIGVYENVHLKELLYKIEMGKEKLGFNAFKAEAMHNNNGMKTVEIGGKLERNSIGGAVLNSAGDLVASVREDEKARQVGVSIDSFADSIRYLERIEFGSIGYHPMPKAEKSKQPAKVTPSEFWKNIVKIEAGSWQKPSASQSEEAQES